VRRALIFVGIFQNSLPNLSLGPFPEFLSFIFSLSRLYRFFMALFESRGLGYSPGFSLHQISLGSWTLELSDGVSWAADKRFDSLIHSLIHDPYSGSQCRNAI
jgi:hypothetical protein